MTDSNNNEEVKEFTETVTVKPTNDEETVESEEEEKSPDSSSEENKEPEQETEAEVETENIEEKETEVEVEPEQEAETQEEVEPELKSVEGETPRERALRLEVTRVKAKLRDQQKEDLFVKKPTNTSKKDEELEKYDQEQLKTFETLAVKLGFVKKDEIISQTIQDKLNSEFDSFIESHQEYSPENDKDGVLWNQFKSEFSLYNPPQDPKTLKKILNKVHNDIFGVQPAKNLNKINASKEKIKVASHSGASAGKETKQETQQPSGLRLDALKGFSEEDKKELFG